MAINKSDWINHSISFISTILGILIALQLDDWSEERDLNNKINKSIYNVELELNTNRIELQNIIGANEMYIGALDFIVKHETQPGIINYQQAELQNLTSDQIEHLVLKVMDSTENSMTAKVHVVFDTFLTFRTQNQNWESLKYSGYIALANRDSLNDYFWIYDLLSTDFGDNDIIQLNKKLNAAKLNSEFLQILLDNKKSYEIKLRYLENFIKQRQLQVEEVKK